MNNLIISFLTLFTGSNVISHHAIDKSLLWEVTGKNISKPSYLFGTIHVMCSNNLIVDTLMSEKFNQAEQLFLELNIDDIKLLSGAMQQMMMKDNITLHDLLTKEAYDSTAQNFEELTKIPLALVSKLKPIMAMSFIYPAIMGCQPEAWEQKFAEMANEKNIPLKGLETVQQQVDVLDSIPLKVQANLFANALKDIDSLKKSFNIMLQLYKEKDIEALYKQTESEEDFSEYEGVLINNRNTDWVSTIISEAYQKPTFFAFGAAHLAGENGVINLLRKKGYTVKPVLQ